MRAHGYSVARFEDAPTRVVTNAPEELAARVAVAAAARAGRSRDPQNTVDDVPPSGTRLRSQRRRRRLHRIRHYGGVAHYPFQFRFVTDDGFRREAVLYATDRLHASRLVRNYFEAHDVVLLPGAEVRVRWLPFDGAL